jgi:hypothetical protein
MKTNLNSNKYKYINSPRCGNLKNANMDSWENQHIPGLLKGCENLSSADLDISVLSDLVFKTELTLSYLSACSPDCCTTVC